MGFNDNGTVNKSHDAMPAVWRGKGTDSVVLEPGTYYFIIRIFQKGTGCYKLKIK